MSLPALKGNDLHWLVCPSCHQGLKLEAGAVCCIGCGRRYPVIDGIPVLLVERALQTL
jgi:uncharacterized protein YbaR (Trm112 family)